MLSQKGGKRKERIQNDPIHPYVSINYKHRLLHDLISAKSPANIGLGQILSSNWKSSNENKQVKLN